jgi:C4-dicarboxylate transporter, DctQ subunit
LKSAVDKLTKVEQMFIGMLLLIVTGVLFLNVVLRVFNLSFDWAEEFARYGIAWITFIGASTCIYKGAHIGVDAIVGILSEKNKKVLSVITIVISLIFVVLFTYLSLNLTLKVHLTGQMSSTLDIPMVWVYASMPVGGFLMILRYFEQLFKMLKSSKEVDKQ